MKLSDKISWYYTTSPADILSGRTGWYTDTRPDATGSARTIWVHRAKILRDYGISVGLDGRSTGCGVIFCEAFFQDGKQIDKDLI